VHERNGAHVQQAFAAQRAEHDDVKAVLDRRWAEMLRNVMLIVRRYLRILHHRRAVARQSFERLRALCLAGDDVFWSLTVPSTLSSASAADVLRPAVVAVASRAKASPVDLPSFLSNFSVTTPVSGSAILQPYLDALKHELYVPEADWARDGASSSSSSTAAAYAPLELGGVRVTWAGPCCGCCGFSAEIALILTPLSRYVPTRSTIAASCHCKGLPLSVQDTLQRIVVVREDGTLHRLGELRGHDGVVSNNSRAADSHAAGKSYAVMPEGVARSMAAVSPREEAEAGELLWSARLDQESPAAKHPWHGEHAPPVSALLKDLEPVAAVTSSSQRAQRDIAASPLPPPPGDATLPPVLQARRTNALASIVVRDIFRGGLAESDQAVAKQPAPPTSSSAGAGAPPVEVWVYHVDPVQARRMHWPEATIDYKISRSMFEFSRVTAEFAGELKDDRVYDEVWVPSDFVKDSFVMSGVPARKITVIPEPVDTAYFSPVAARKIDLPAAIGRPGWRARSSVGHRKVANEPLRGNFKFLSIFKWEYRKGWEILLHAYFSAFTRSDPVSLYILTYHWWPAVPPGADVRNPDAIWAEVASIAIDMGLIHDALPHIEIITADVTEADVLSLYRSCDAFVLPSRGEGWGLPPIQAMSMAMPTIVTRYSGMLQFTTNDTALYIEVERLERVRQRTSDYGPNEEMEWAVPSQRHLAVLLKEVAFTWTAEQRAALGRRARRHIQRYFGSHAVASLIARRLREIETLVRRRVARGTHYRGNNRTQFTYAPADL
jgi:glycosyltransferase involved in cell wall biosynthesis